jgi:hypothetical protein
MPDRAFLFLFSLLMIAAGVGATVWLLATGQAGTVDGLFLVLTALLIAAAFGLYVVFLVRRAMAESRPAATQPGKATASSTKTAAAEVAQS